MSEEQIKEEYIYEISEEERMIVAGLRLMDSEKKELFLEKARNLATAGK